MFLALLLLWLPVLLPSFAKLLLWCPLIVPYVILQVSLSDYQNEYGQSVCFHFCCRQSFAASCLGLPVAVRFCDLCNEYAYLPLHLLLYTPTATATATAPAPAAASAITTSKTPPTTTKSMANQHECCHCGNNVNSTGIGCHCWRYSYCCRYCLTCDRRC